MGLWLQLTLQYCVVRGYSIFRSRPPPGGSEPNAMPSSFTRARGCIGAPEPVSMLLKLPEARPALWIAGGTVCTEVAT